MSGPRYAINRPDVAHECIGEELVVINFTTGSYYGVRGAGVRIWRLLDAGLNVDEITSRLAAGRALSAEAVQQTVAFVRALEDEQLIVAGAADAPAVVIDADQDADCAFQAPELDRRDDLQDYLTLDPIHDVDAQGWPTPKRP